MRPAPPLFSPPRFMELVLDLRPGHPAVLQVPLGHGGELNPVPRPLPTGLHDLDQGPPGPRDNRPP